MGPVQETPSHCPAVCSPRGSLMPEHTTLPHPSFMQHIGRGHVPSDYNLFGHKPSLKSQLPSPVPPQDPCPALIC